MLVVLPAGPEWCGCVLGLMKLGAVVSPATHTSTPHEIAYRLQQLNAVAIVTVCGGMGVRLCAWPDEEPPLRMRLPIDCSN